MQYSGTRGAQASVRRGGTGLLAIGLLSATVGCSDLPIQLEVAEGSVVTIEVPGEEPTTLEVRGMVRGTTQLALDLETALAGEDLVGSLQIEEVLLAGQQPSAIGGVPAGISCTSLAAESGGTITVNALAGVVRIDAVVNNQTRFTARRARELGAVVLRNPLLAEIPVDLQTLIGVLNGDPLPIDIVQPIDDVSQVENPLQGTRISGDIRFRSPAGDLSAIPGLDRCREFVAEQAQLDATAPELPR